MICEVNVLVSRYLEWGSEWGYKLISENISPNILTDLLRFEDNFSWLLMMDIKISNWLLRIG